MIIGQKTLTTRAAISLIILLASLTGESAAGTLHNFNNNGKDGTRPFGGLILDSSGNLYGTTDVGGAYAVGTVFELSPNAGGGWTEKILHSFNRTDGAAPFASLVFDASGNLYGTTDVGGAFDLGTVFELTPNAGGGWKEKILHSFNSNGKDGNYVAAGVILDSSGNIYGATRQGGTYNEGTVFELTPKPGGGWAEKVLHSFGNGTDGAQCWGGLIFDASGNLYGTTIMGGSNNSGTVFELIHKASGAWAERVLFSFDNRTNGYEPFSGLVFDSLGNLYGTTFNGGLYGRGEVFELTPSVGGGWTESVPYNFYSNVAQGLDPYDGAYPYGSLVIDSAGNLYGTTENGGSDANGGTGWGTVFILSPVGSNQWTEIMLYIFDGRNGEIPTDGIVFDAAGNLYGTTSYGGSFGYGTVFEIRP